MALSLETIPAEIVVLILSHLPIPALLSFGLTCKKNHAYHFMSLSTLQLAVFPRKVHALVAFLEPSTRTIPKPHNHVPVIISSRSPEVGRSSYKRVVQSPSVALANTIQDQNYVLADIVFRYGAALRDLEFLAWDLNTVSATALAQSCSGLRQLALCFDHPNVRDRTLPRTYFESPGPGSTMWNALAGIGHQENKSLKLRTLQRLTLERVGITEFQLIKFVEANPGLIELRFKKCAGVGREFLSWLSESVQGRERLEVLWIQNCDGATSRGEPGLSWVEELSSLKSLSFKYCVNIEADVVKRLNEELWHIPTVIPPYSPSSPHPRDIPLEVDPDYK